MTRKLLIFLVCVVIASSSLFHAQAASAPALPELSGFDGQLDYDESLEPDFSFFASGNVIEPVTFWGLDNIVLTSNYVSLSDFDFKNVQVFGFLGLNTLGAFYIYLNRDDLIEYSIWENPDTHRFAFQFVSYSPIYGVAFNQSTGEPVSFASHVGLTQQSSVGIHGSLVNGKVYNNVHIFTYTLIDKSFGIVTNKSISKYVWNVDYDVTQYYFGAASAYPTPETYSELKEDERHEETGSWISRLGDRISEFFETLKNWLLWFSADGQDSYTNPFSDILSDIQLFFDKQVSDTNDFKDSLSDTLDNVVGYISSGSGVISSVLTGVPILSAFVAFFVVFAVIRKVVGR